MAPVVIRPYRLVGILALALVLGACRLPYVPGVTSPPPSAGATLRDATGRIVRRDHYLLEIRDYGPDALPAVPNHHPEGVRWRSWDSLLSQVPNVARCAKCLNYRRLKPRRAVCASGWRMGKRFGFMRW